MDSSACRATPPGVVLGLVLAVFCCIAAIVLYAGWTGQRQLDPANIQREAAIAVHQGRTTADLPPDARAALEASGTPSK